jgi:hypothetical protein
MPLSFAADPAPARPFRGRRNFVRRPSAICQPASLAGAAAMSLSARRFRSQALAKFYALRST